MYQNGGDHAKVARKKIEDFSEKMIRGMVSGSENNAAQVYSTSMAILALAVNFHYLPICQK
tara:strand:+ start:1889 stop:2071 length:183 start_codon:yes stop_codon:yes gene_type:complete